MFFIVINPIARLGQSILRLPMLEKLFDANGIPYETCITTGVADGYEKTLKFCKRNPNCKGVIGVGGDGIIQEIVAGMADTFPGSHNGEKIPIPLGILPAATSNDFNLTLDGGKSRVKGNFEQEPEVAVKNFFDMLMKGRVRTVDLITASGMAFLNIGHVGLDAEVAQDADALKLKYGEHVYTVAAVKRILKYTGTQLSVETDIEKQEGKYTLVAVCNAQYYAGGIRLAPSAKIDDGKITLCVMKRMSRLKTMFIFIAAMFERHTRMKGVSFTECERVKITLPSAALCLDGNIYRREGEIEFKVLPQVLDVFV